MSLQSKKRLLFIAHEMSPYLELTDFAQLLNKLAVKSNDSGYEVRVIMPRFGVINERRHRLHEVVRLSGINIIVDKEDYPLVIKVASLPNARLQVYFMDNEDYFKRKEAFREEDGTFYEDNADRIIFFCKSALETVKKFGWPPDVIHCSGWMTSLVPLYLKTAYKKEPVFASSKVVYSVQANSFDEKLGASFIKKALVSNLIKEKDLEPYKETTNQALNEGACKYADAIVHVDAQVDQHIVEEYKAGRTRKVVKFSEKEERLEDYLELFQKLAQD